MSLWHQAFDDMNVLEADADAMSVDQRLKLAEVKALLAIGQELSRIHHDGISPEYRGEAS